MMARSLKGSINRPDTEAQDQPSPNHHFRLATRGRSIQKGHVWTVPAVQEDFDVLAKRSGAAMYPACFRLEDYLCRDAAAMAAGPDVIR